MPSSAEIVVIADANVLLAAIANRAAIKVFDSDIHVYTTEFTCAEVAEYVPYFSERYRITVERMMKTMKMLPLSIKDKEFYQDSMGKAKKLMEDPEDVDVAALALVLDAPVWSNDNHFKKFPTGRYTTAQLLKALGK